MQTIRAIETILEQELELTQFREATFEELYILGEWG